MPKVVSTNHESRTRSRQFSDHEHGISPTITNHDHVFFPTTTTFSPVFFAPNPVEYGQIWPFRPDINPKHRTTAPDVFKQFWFSAAKTPRLMARAMRRLGLADMAATEATRHLPVSEDEKNVLCPQFVFTLRKILAKFSRRPTLE